MDYRTEEEQIEQLKRLWRQYGLPIIIGVVLALGLSYIWHAWQNKQQLYRERAADIYWQMLADADNSDEQAKSLMTDYKNTPYASIAAMQLAKQAVTKGDLPEAQAKLHWVMEHARDTALQQLAVLRSARVYLAQQQPQLALELLAKYPQIIYAAYAAQIRGDALLALAKNQEAKQAYAEALQLLPNADNTKPLLQMKYDAIPA